MAPRHRTMSGNLFFFLILCISSLSMSFYKLLISSSLGFPSQQQDNRSNDHSLNWVIYPAVSCWHRRPPPDHQGCWDSQVIRTDGFLFLSHCSVSWADENTGSPLVEAMETAAPADIWPIPMFMGDYNPSTSWGVATVSTIPLPTLLINWLEYHLFPLENSWRPSPLFLCLTQHPFCQPPHLRSDMLMTGSSWNFFGLWINLAKQNLDEFWNVRRHGGPPVWTWSDKFLLPVKATTKMLALVKSIL